MGSTPTGRERCFRIVRRDEGRVDYDVSPDGQQFLTLNAGGQDGPPTEIVLLLNWTEELKRLVPTTGQNWIAGLRR